MFWPPEEERRLLGRFYLSSCLGYGLALIVPFQFAYLYLVMEQPEWAVIPLIVSSAVALTLDMPTGLISDRWSRKKSTLLGYAISAASWVAIPFAVAQEGQMQLLAVSACFAFDGLGAAFASGAEESWAVDNLNAQRRPDLIEQFFARSYSFEALGSVIAGCVAFAIVLSISVNGALLDALWFATAAGQMLAVVLLLPMPELRGEDAPNGPPIGGAGAAIIAGLRLVFRSRALLFFLLALVVAAFSDSAPEDAFVISMLTKGLDARALAPLAIVEDVIGLAAPILALAIARHMGVRRFLSVFLIVPALAVSALLLDQSLWLVIVLCLVLDTCAALWDPIAETHLHRLIPSGQRATITSLVNQLTSASELAGLAVFALMLGDSKSALDKATPDLVMAFSGEPTPAVHLPAVALGLSLPDLAIVSFVLAGLLAVPLLALSVRKAKLVLTRKPIGGRRRRDRKKLRPPMSQDHRGQ